MLNFTTPHPSPNYHAPEISKSTRISNKSIQADHSTGGKVPLMRATLRPIN